MIDPTKFLDWLKLAPRYLLGIAFATGIYLLLGQAQLEKVGFWRYDRLIRPWTFVVFLISAAFLAAHLASDGLSHLREKSRERRKKRRLEARLHDLTPDEQETLAGYLRENTKTSYLDAMSGVTGGLEAAGIIYRSSSLGSGGFRFAYNLQPWAWEYLKANPGLVGVDSSALCSPVRGRAGNSSVERTETAKSTVPPLTS